MDREAESIALEKKHVKDVYEKIAKHFTDKRYKAWPQVKEFLNSLEPGSVVADVGCGSGKYLNINKDIHVVGSDCCCKLADISRARGNEIMVCDNLSLPYRDNCFDAVISIAVIHHFATVERRIQAVQELARICRPGGLLMIYVWAMEQKHRKFDAQDVLVPWHMPQKHSKHRSKLYGERLSQRSTSFTIGCPDEASSPSVSAARGGVSSSDTSPARSPQHSMYPPSQPRVLTKCLSDVSLQPKFRRAPSMQDSSVYASSQSLTSLPGDEDGSSKDRLISRQSDEVRNDLMLPHVGSSIYEDTYVDISFGNSRSVVKERLYKEFNCNGKCPSESNLGEGDPLAAEERENEGHVTLGGSLSSLGSLVEVNPLVAIMKSLAHLEESLSLSETQTSGNHHNGSYSSDGLYKDLRIRQLTPKHAAAGVNSVSARGETYLKRTRGHSRSASSNDQTSRDSSMESLSSSGDDSITTFPVDSKTETRKQHLDRRHRRARHELDRVSRSVPGSPHVTTNGSNHFFGRSNSEPDDQGNIDLSKFFRYYHVFREGELADLIGQHVPTLHIVKDHFDHANWCVVAEKVQCWSI